MLHTYKNAIGALTFIPSGGGVFEVAVNGEPVHSKSATGQFPDDAQIVAVVGKRIGA